MGIFNIDNKFFRALNKLVVNTPEDYKKIKSEESKII